MSFPYHDKYWCDVATFVDGLYRRGERILAPDLFWWRYDEIFRYANLALNPRDRYDWVIVHKGELNRFPMAFLENLPSGHRAAMANEVFVVWAAREDVAPLESSPHLDAFAGLVELRKGRPFEPQADDDLHEYPDPGRITKLGALDKQGLAKAMDRFYSIGGYEYPTRRDKAFYEEIDRRLRAFWTGLENAVVLDVACGNGRVARTVPEFRTMVEIDISPVAVRLARGYAKGDTRRDAKVMDAESLAFADASFDAVTFVEAVEHVHDPARVLREAARVLRPGGVFIMNGANTDSLNQLLNRKLGYPPFVTNYHHIHEFSWAETRALLDDAGLEIEEAQGIFLFPYWGVPNVDQHVRAVTDNDTEMVEALRVLGERAGPELAYCSIVRARRR